MRFVIKADMRGKHPTSMVRSAPPRSKQPPISGRQALPLPCALPKASQPHTRAPRGLCELDLWPPGSCSACAVATV